MATLSAIGIVVGIISSVLVIVHTVSLLIKESKQVTPDDDEPTAMPKPSGTKNGQDEEAQNKAA
ncbi:hypothetical protein D5F52_26545 (plasmid) [Brevibacillus laterosporus]|uniref:hypothetical protein n=1 Tax=Brevibacillus laterosporus TaxID=1465 RepID=UPI000E6B8EA9|nr:hypothetical protein [Brevibacillus laterosporus]AYB41716.1 hypothetical protein D5F52_26545 [Brevibacillus laterosporus]